jgi:hypothetical protein
MPDPRWVSAHVDENALHPNTISVTQVHSSKCAYGTSDSATFLHIERTKCLMDSESARFHFDHDQFSCASISHQQINLHTTHHKIATQWSIPDRSEMFLGNPFGPDALSSISVTVP